MPVAIRLGRMRVRLTLKLAEEIDGVNLTSCDAGDVLDLGPREAQMLIAEGWAVAERRVEGPSTVVAFRRHTDLGHCRDEDDESRAS